MTSMRPAACAASARSVSMPSCAVLRPPEVKHPAASGADDRFERLPGIARHVERPVKRHLHPSASRTSCAVRVSSTSPAGVSSPKTTPVGSVFAGEADLFGHQRHLVVGVEKISAPGGVSSRSAAGPAGSGHSGSVRGRGRAAFEGAAQVRCAQRPSAGRCRMHCGYRCRVQSS